VALNFGIAHPEMARSLIVAGTGTGSTDPKTFRLHVNERAAQMRAGGMAAMEDYAQSSSRVQLRRKDPNGYEEFRSQLAEHSNIGSAHTFAGVQGRRPPIFDLEPKLRALQVPTLIMTGDEDDDCIEPSIFMKRAIPGSGLVVFPRSGHAINLEEPDLFHRTVADFLSAVELGKWGERATGVAAGSLT
jgi:pimeloyl-ACP methyl ester carboxylesterase